MAEKTPTLRGFLVPDLGWRGANIDTANTSLTERNPRPGSSVAGDSKSLFVPHISGGQSTDIKTEITSGGGLGESPDDTVQLKFREGSGDNSSSDVWYGWSDFDAVSRWEAVDYSATSITFIGGTVNSETQKAVCVYIDDVGATDTWKSVTYDPQTRTWGSPVTIASSLSITGTDCVYLPSGRLIAVSIQKSGAGHGSLAYYSDDDGATWTKLATYDFAYISCSLRIAYGSGSLLMMVEDLASNVIDQYVSIDLANSWTEVNAVAGTWDSNGDGVDVKSLPTGEFAIVYSGVVTGNVGDLRLVIIPNPWRPAFDYVDEGEVDTILDVSAEVTTVDGFCIESFNNGIYLYVADEDELKIKSAFASDVKLEDEWPALTSLFDTNSSNRNIGDMICLNSMGENLILHLNQANSSNDDQLGAFFLGGWHGNLTLEDKNQSGTNVNQLWYPSDTPALMGWTDTTTGTGAITLNDGYVRFDVPAATDEARTSETSIFPANTSDHCAVEAILRTNRSAPAVSLNDSVGFHVYLNTSDPEINFFLSAGGSNGFYIVDEGGTILFDVSNAASNFPDMTDWTQIVLWTTDFDDTANDWQLHLAWREVGDIDWNVPDPITMSEVAGGSTEGVHFGALGANSAEAGLWVDFKYLSATLGPNQIEYTYNEITTTNDSDYPLTGGPVFNRPQSIPVAGETTGDNKAAYLSGSRGPANIGEEYFIDAQSDFPIESIFPDISPSPSSYWEDDGTVSDSGASLWVDLEATDRKLFGDNLYGIMLRNTNVRDMKIYGTVASSSTLIADLTSDGQRITEIVNDSTVTGSFLTVSSNQANSGHRYIWSEELSKPYKGWVYFNNPSLSVEGGEYVKENTPGFFDNTADKETRLTLEDNINTGGTVWVHASSGLVIFKVDSAYDGLRIEFPAQEVPDGRIKIGTMLAGPIVIPGRQWSNGWNWSLRPNVNMRRDRKNTSIGEKLGEASRDLTISWSDGFDLTKVRDGNANHLTWFSGERAVAYADDVWKVMDSVLRKTDSGALPLVAINNIPSSDIGTTPHIITDPTQFVYGRIESQISSDHVVGDEGVDELLRLGSVTIREVV